VATFLVAAVAIVFIAAFAFIAYSVYAAANVRRAWRDGERSAR
jgi:hypothetical protein